MSKWGYCGKVLILEVISAAEWDVTGVKVCIMIYGEGEIACSEFQERYPHMKVMNVVEYAT